MTEARRSVSALRPERRRRRGHATALKRIADVGRRTTDVPIDLSVDELPRFGGGVEREIIGIAQEALTNARPPCPRAAHHHPRVDRAIDRLPRSRSPTMAAGSPRMRTPAASA